jgi:hypothetical protein
LIKHYIKFDDIVERMIEGLRKAGLIIGGQTDLSR